METLNHLSLAVMLLIPTAAAARAIHCLIRITTDSDQENIYIQRLKNLLIFVVVAMSISGLLAAILNYFIYTSS